MDMKKHILLWNQASVEVIDIRLITLVPGEPAVPYRLPASAYLYATRGQAKVMLDHTLHVFSASWIIHGGKGDVLEFMPGQEVLEYYLILYRARLTLSARKELLAAMERDNPLQMPYGFRPENPVSLYVHAEAMLNSWQLQTPLRRLQVKGLFYQWGYELLHQLQKQSTTQKDQPDLLEQALTYMQQHYHRNFTLQQLADAVSSSPRTLSRLYKSRLQTSPAQYLIRIRMEKAHQLLLNTDAGLEDIAQRLGYPDAYSFGRTFKKYYGLSPIRYKKQQARHSHWPDMPFPVTQSDIVDRSLLRYIDYDNHYQYNQKGELPMYRNTKPSLLLILMLCCTLLLSACAPGAANSANSTPTPAAATSPAPSAPANSADVVTSEAETRTIATVKGDIVVPAQPQRVVVLYLLGDVLALGIKPIGVSDVSEGAAFENELKDVQKLGSWFEASPEAILALDPDLIIVPSEETYEALHLIAPTVLVPYEKMTAEERVSFIGQVVGKEDQAQTLFDNFNTKVEDAKQKLQAAGILDKTVSIMEGGKDRSMAVVSSKQFGRGSQVIYEYLGMKAPKIVQDKIDISTGADGESVSFEVLADYSGDYIFRSSYDGMADLTSDPLWNSLPAVQQGHLIEIDFGLAYYSDIFSMDAQLDYIVKELLATVE
ncbi:AraC family transcriptional regulator [Paenibacillus donghaensis]|uniref:AraC family transcriptional regulator n=1 Tax=Paenibacillus donghaensis TaxID=414771 RepID=A0A2Z2KGB8_9BACL|nr:AraC family transcriptional regulator [Paenibacillus donghaensis]ASA22200.1 hypothetical protein B9T62_16275 [Paenibacillus donghaensis]